MFDYVCLILLDSREATRGHLKKELESLGRGKALFTCYFREGVILFCGGTPEKRKRVVERGTTCIIIPRCERT